MVVNQDRSVAYINNAIYGVPFNELKHNFFSEAIKFLGKNNVIIGWWSYPSYTKSIQQRS